MSLERKASQVVATHEHFTSFWHHSNNKGPLQSFVRILLKVQTERFKTYISVLNGFYMCSIDVVHCFKQSGAPQEEASDWVIIILFPSYFPSILP